MDGTKRLRADEAEAIRELREQQATTRRATVPALEEILYEALPVLDRGFVRVIDYMGDDGAIVQAARVSYGRGTRHVSSDRGLIEYLMRHRHTSPFEMCEIKLHVKLPVFVARQWIRHRTASVNEYSARYSVLDDEFYIPDREHLAAQSPVNRQGRAEPIPDDDAQYLLRLLRTNAERAYERYREMLNEDEAGEPLDAGRAGLARELARIALPLNIYTQWYWKTDLHNLLHFLACGLAPGTEPASRAYAVTLLDLLRRWAPLTSDAFLNYQLEAATLSRTSLSLIRRIVSGERITESESGLGPREWRELMSVLGRDVDA